MQHSALPGIRLRTDLSVSVNDIFGCRQCKKSHWSSCMKFLSADSNLCTKPKFISIGKPRGCVHINGRRIYLIQEFLSMAVIIGNDRL